MDGPYTEYVNFNGETIAEKDQTGALTDYIFAGGKRIAKVAPVRVLHHFGVCGNCIGGASNFQIPALASNLGGYAIRSGDRLVFSQKQTNARAGLYLFATDGTNSIGSLTDQNGDWINSSSVADGTWHTRVVSLNGWAGKTIGTNLGVSVEGNTPTGVNWDSQIADIALVSVDGTVHTLFNRQNVSASTGNSSSGSNFAILTSTDTVPETHFYLGDHLGTAQMEFAGEGWPVWQGQFAPFGGELDSQTTANHYKFTGKERDSESGLDYFGARYYVSSMGRMISPDPMMASAKVWDPQTWNRYSYARNNPLSFIDPMGMAEVNAAQCAKDSACVTVNVNVIYDKNANGGDGLTDKQKASFEKNQLQNAKDQYGNADIHLNVTYSAGTVTNDGGKISVSGLQAGALNVVVTDQINGAVSGASASHMAVSFIPANGAKVDDLPHEMAHQFMGDTWSPLAHALSKDSSGITHMIDNMFTDVTNDTARAAMNNVTPHLPKYPSGAPMSIFNPQARAFQNFITPQTQPK